MELDSSTGDLKLDYGHVSEVTYNQSPETEWVITFLLGKRSGERGIVCPLAPECGGLPIVAGDQ